MNRERDARAANKLLAQFASMADSRPVYKWIWAPDLTHLRFKGMEYKRAPGQLILSPIPTYEKVQAYPNIGKRWVLCKFQQVSEEEWLRSFQSKMVWPRNGDYYPTDMIMREGRSPSVETTEEIISRIKRNLTRSASDLESEFLSYEQRREKAVDNTIYDIIEDSLTVGGGAPGKRSGGVSIFTGKPESRDITASDLAIRRTVH